MIRCKKSVSWGDLNTQGMDSPAVKISSSSHLTAFKISKRYLELNDKVTGSAPPEFLLDPNLKNPMLE